MNKGGIGVGSASIVLVFAVLCLTMFALISYAAAAADKAMTDAEARTVKGYYEADTLAERVLAAILEEDKIPAAALGIDITTGRDEEAGADIAVFFCPVSDNRELYVKAAIYEDSYDILAWRMRDAGEWEADEALPVWLGV